MNRIITGLLTSALMLNLSGCAQLTTVQPSASSQPAQLQHMYDYQLLTPEGQAIDFRQLTAGLAEADVVFIGEYHTHPAAHLLQMQLLAALYQQDPRLIVSMEQFSRDAQPVIDQYLTGEIGEQQLIDAADAWSNYASDYRPLVDYARQHQLTLVAANTPLAVVRCVAIEGPEVVGRLTDSAQNWVAADLSNPAPAYLEKYQQVGRSMAFSCHQPDEADKGNKEPSSEAVHHHGHGKAGRVKRHSFSAQLARDNTMAESIYRALQANPQHRVLHTNGTFHSEEHLGTVAALKRLDPSLKIRVISPVYQTEPVQLSTERGTQRGDYLYLLQAMPERYLQSEFCSKAMAMMMHKRAVQQCSLLDSTGEGAGP